MAGVITFEKYLTTLGENPFALMSDEDELTERVAKLIWEFARRYYELVSKYPDAGLTDTVTVDEICLEVENLLRYFDEGILPVAKKKSRCRRVL